MDARNFEDFYDDTTDEDEEFSHSHSAQNIPNALKELKRQNLTTFDMKFSLIVHALGRHILSTPKIKSPYLLLKRKFLGNQKIINQSDFTHWVRWCISISLVDTMGISQCQIEGAKFGRRIFRSNIRKIHQIAEHVSTIRRRFIISAKSPNPDTSEAFTGINSLIEDIKLQLRDFEENPPPEFEEVHFSNFTNKVDVKSLISEEGETFEYFNAMARSIIRNTLDEHNCLTTSGRISMGTTLKNRLQKTLSNFQNSALLMDQYTTYVLTQVINLKAYVFPTEFIKQNVHAVEELIASDMIKGENTKGDFGILDSNGKLKEGVSLKESTFAPIGTKMRYYSIYSWNRFLKDLYRSVNEDLLEKLCAQFALSPQSFHRRICPRFARKFSNIQHKINSDICDGSGEGKCSDIFPEFLAFIKVCNKSAHRVIKNRDEIAVLKINSPQFYHSFKFSSCYSVVEREEINLSNSRVSQVHSSGNYSSVSDKINTILAELNKKAVSNSLKERFNDSDFACWVLKTINGGGNEIRILSDKIKSDNKENIHDVLWLEDMAKEVIFDLTYLLFGLEVKRSPAAIVNHLIMLDLILKKHLSWRQCLSIKKEETEDEVPGHEEVQNPEDLKFLLLKNYARLDVEIIGGGYMPMSFKGATPSARMLNNIYNDFLPEQYEYAGPAYKISDKSVKELVKRETVLLSLWLDRVAGFRQKYPVNEVLPKIQEFLMEKLPVLDLKFD